MTERLLQLEIVEYARKHGWKVMHVDTARTGGHWTTATVYDGKGWPDLVMLRGSRLVVAELKAPKGKVSPEQYIWLDAFRAVGAEAFVWREDDLDQWQDVLL